MRILHLTNEELDVLYNTVKAVVKEENDTLLNTIYTKLLNMRHGKWLTMMKQCMSKFSSIMQT